MVVRIIFIPFRHAPSHMHKSNNRFVCLCYFSDILLVLYLPIHYLRHDTRVMALCQPASDSFRFSFTLFATFQVVMVATFLGHLLTEETVLLLFEVHKILLFKTISPENSFSNFSSC